MRFGTWNVRSMYRPVSLTTLARELARYKLGWVGVQEVRWDKGGTVRAGDYIFFYWKGRENHWLGTGFFVHHRIVSAVKRVEFVPIGCHVQFWEVTGVISLFLMCRHQVRRTVMIQKTVFVMNLEQVVKYIWKLSLSGLYNWGCPTKIAHALLSDNVCYLHHWSYLAWVFY